MRRTDREVKDFSEIVDILTRAETIRLGLQGAEYPYVVPLSFGIEAGQGRISLYFHGAGRGLKHDLIAANPNVCVEADLFHGYAEVPGSATTRYESVIGYGKVRRCAGDEAVKGLNLLMAHCGFPGAAYDCGALDATAVYCVELEAFAGKRNL